MIGGAGGSGGGMVCQYLNGIIRGIMGTLVVDNVKWIGGPLLKKKFEVACILEVVRNFTGRT